MVPVLRYLLVALLSGICAAQEIDAALLAEVRDGTHQERLKAEAELVASLCGRSQELAAPLAELLPVGLVRSDPDEFRGQVYSVQGRVTALLSPSLTPGVYGLVIEAAPRVPVILLCDRAMVGIGVGALVRAKGTFVKLRDLPPPLDIDRAPQLVVDRVIPRYLDWQAQTAIDPQIMALAHPGTWNHALDGFSHTGDMQLGLRESQGVPLWHLASYAMWRDRQDREEPAEQLVSALVRRFQLNAIKHGQVAPGSSQRLVAVFSEARSIEVGPNPLGQPLWTEVFVKVTDLASKLVPIWIPGSIDSSWHKGEQVDVSGYYYRGYAYIAVDDSVRWTPVFVATGLKRLVLPRPSLTETVMIWLIFAVALGIVGLFFVLSFRGRRAEALHAAARLARRRRRAGS